MNLPPGPKLFRCGSCAAEFTESVKFEDHCRNHNMDKNPEFRSSYRCSICFAVYKSMEGVRRHLRITHLGIKPFKCTVCYGGFQILDDLRAHMELNHAGKRLFKCTKCSEDFTNILEFEDHWQLHNVDKPDKFKCTLCAAAFSEAEDLQQHMLKHEREKRFKCSVCSMSFKQAEDLKVHANIHTEEKPFQCPICPSAFNTSQGLTQHMYTHTGERPFRCPICDTGFSYSGDLNQHMSSCHTHRGTENFKCPICDEGFSMSVHLQIHMEKHLAAIGDDMFAPAEMNPALGAAAFFQANGANNSSSSTEVNAGAVLQHLINHDAESSNCTVDTERTCISADLLQELEEFTSEELVADTSHRSSFHHCVCGTMFTSAALYLAHSKCHDRNNSMQCFSCKYVALDNHDFFLHIMQHKC